jgi:hypothetical protein
MSKPRAQRYPRGHYTRKQFFEKKASALKSHDVACGIPFDYECVSIDGAAFYLLREPEHTEEQITKAVIELRNNRDVVGMWQIRLEDCKL